MKALSHVSSLLTFWKSSVSRKMTFYFTIFGIIIFYATSTLYLMAFRQSMVNSITNLIHNQFEDLEDVNESDFIWHSIGKFRPDIYGTLKTFLSLSPDLYAIEDVSIYCKQEKKSAWYRIFFKNDQVIYKEPASDAILKKLDRKLKAPLILSNFHFFITKENLTLYHNITGENDDNKYFLKLILHRKGLGGVLTTLGIHITIITVILLVLTRILGYLFSRKFAKPIEILSEGVASVSNGDMNISIDVRSKDEIGTLAKNFNLMMEGLKERDFIKETFGKYVTKEIRDEILKGRIPLDGELKEVSILFADLRNITTLAEIMAPKDVAKLINEYFKEMTEAIQFHKGLVIQFIGDEIEAVFGAPLPLPDHPSQAVHAAIEMRKRLHLLNNRLEEKNMHRLQHGIGIHTGHVLAANIGSPDRLSYTLVGDTVNIASRIQELNKDFGTDILISSTTYAALTNNLKLEKLPDTPIRGKSEPVELYKV